MSEIKLHRLSKIYKPTKGTESADSLVRSRAINSDERSRGMEILLQAQQNYAAGYRWRKDRERNKRYTYGDQWGDKICIDGVMMTEEEYIKRQGKVPLKTNLIRRLVKNVIGTYRDQQAEPICMARDRDEQQEAETLSTLLQYNMQLNRMDEVYARTMEEFLIGAFVVHKKSFGWRHDRMDCWTDYVAPNNFIPDPNMHDFRGWDCSFVGEIHDLSFGELCQQMATTPRDYAKLAEIYKAARNARANTTYWDDFGYSRDTMARDFLYPRDPNRCRVIEVWRKESKPRYRCHDFATGTIEKIDIEDAAVVALENQRRWEQAQKEGIPYEEVPFISMEWFMDDYWYYYFLSPMGDILREGETPYAHKSHPYVFKPYPYTDGEIHSFVSDVIDQQRYINRMIILQDMIMGASAKGLLMVPDDVVPDDEDPKEWADTWTKFNGVMFYKVKNHGKVPQQVAANSTNIGVHEFLALQMKSMEDVSGINSALQGKASFAGESGSHAQAMQQNAATSLIDILECFHDFQSEAAYKDVKNIQQCYDDKKVLNIAGRNAKHFDVNPHKVLNAEVDISISPSKKTPVYRAMANDFYLQLFQMQAIDLEQLLESVSDIPFSDDLLQSIRSRREQAEQGQLPQAMPPEQLQALQEGANMDAVNRIDAALRA